MSSNQLHDMVTNPDQYSILGVDPTFNLGEFSVTVTTFKHLQLIERHTGKPPVLLDPMLVHQKTKEPNYFLVSSVVGLCPDLNSLVAFGTDGEKSLGDAFQMQFREAQHLLCFIHVRGVKKTNLN